jgi:hypothetical protein
MLFIIYIFFAQALASYAMENQGMVPSLKHLASAVLIKENLLHQNCHALLQCNNMESLIMAQHLFTMVGGDGRQAELNAINLHKNIQRVLEDRTKNEEQLRLYLSELGIHAPEPPPSDSIMDEVITILNLTHTESKYSMKSTDFDNDISIFRLLSLQ